jgi:hypothetical protein
LQQALLVVQLLGEVFALMVGQDGKFEVEPLKSCSPFPGLLSEAERATLKDEGNAETPLRMFHHAALPPLNATDRSVRAPF